MGGWRDISNLFFNSLDEPQFKTPTTTKLPQPKLPTTKKISVTKKETIP